MLQSNHGKHVIMRMETKPVISCFLSFSFCTHIPLQVYLVWCVHVFILGDVLQPWVAVVDDNIGETIPVALHIDDCNE